MAHSLCSPKTPQQHVTDTLHTSVNSQQQRTNEKTWPEHDGTFSQQQQSQVPGGTVWTGDDHANKLSQFER